MNKVPKISVIVPAYNEEDFIEKSLLSLKVQKFQDFEVIVINNNSTDRTAELVKKFKVRLVSEKKQGIFYAVQRGYSEARGSIVARVDADSMIFPDWLEKINNFFSENPSTVALTGKILYQDKGFFVSLCSDLVVYFIYYQLASLLMGHLPIVGSNCAIKKEMWRKIKKFGHEPLVFEDMDLSCRLSEFGQIAYLNDLVAISSPRWWRGNFLGRLTEYGGRYLRSIFLNHHLLKRHSKVY